MCLAFEISEEKAQSDVKAGGEVLLSSNQPVLSRLLDADIPSSESTPALPSCRPSLTDGAIAIVSLANHSYILLDSPLSLLQQ